MGGIVFVHEKSPRRGVGGLTWDDLAGEGLSWGAGDGLVRFDLTGVY